MDGEWNKYGLQATMPADGGPGCCGPFAATYGVKGGKGCKQCGSMMHNEILAAGFETYEDEASGSTIGYMKEDSADAYTKAGTWISYLSKNAMQKQVKWA